MPGSRRATVEDVTRCVKCLDPMLKVSHVAHRRRSIYVNGGYDLYRGMFVGGCGVRWLAVVKREVYGIVNSSVVGLYIHDAPAGNWEWRQVRWHHSYNR